MRVAVLGLGEAGGRFATDLVAAGVQVAAFDPGPVPSPEGVERWRRAGRRGRTQPRSFSP